MVFLTVTFVFGFVFTGVRLYVTFVFFGIVFVRQVDLVDFMLNLVSEIVHELL